MEKLGKGLWLQAAVLLVIFLNNGLVDHLENVAFFLISSMVLGLLDQLLIFPKSCLIELLGFLLGLGLLGLWHLICPRLLTGSGLLHMLISYGISGQMFGCTSSFHSNGQLQVVLDGKFSQEYPVNAGVPQGSILGPTVFLLMMLSVILLSMLMILLSILSVIRRLICANNLNWLQNLNVIYKTMWTRVRSGLVISMLRKLSWFHLTVLITMVLLM